MTPSETEGTPFPGDLRQRIQQTVDDMHAEGADFQADGAVAPVARKRLHAWLGILAALIAVELAVIGVAARMEGGDTTALPAAASPCERSLRSVEAALEAFRAEEGRLPGTLQLLVPKHLAAIPKAGGTSVEYEGQGSGYVLRCAGVN